MTCSAKPRSGFSLLETILAVAMAAVLMGLIAAGMQLYTQVVADRNAAVTNAQVARAVLQQIAIDLRSAIYEEADDASGSLDPEDSTTTADIGDTGDTSTSSADGDTATSGETTDLADSTIASVPGLYGNESQLRVDVHGNFPHPLRYDSIVQAGGDPLLENLVSVDQVVSYYLRSASSSELVGTPLESVTTDQSQQTTILVRRVQKRAGSRI